MERKKTIELVHSDLCYMNKPSVSNARYILTFIYDFSRYTWVYLFKNKSHTFQKFKEFMALVEEQCVQLVQCLRSNNDGENVDKVLENHMPQNGISW